MQRCRSFFFFNDTATTEIYTLSLHDALPICAVAPRHVRKRAGEPRQHRIEEILRAALPLLRALRRSEEHTSELQSQSNLVCRLLLEKKKKNTTNNNPVLYSLTNSLHTTLFRY